MEDVSDKAKEVFIAFAIPVIPESIATKVSVFASLLKFFFSPYLFETQTKILKFQI